jgi:hypothetical protein
LTDYPGAYQRFPVRKASKQLDRCQLSARANQLGKCRQDTELKGAGPEQEGKRGKILFTAALGNGLGGAVPEAVPAAWFSEILFDGLR